MVYIHTDNCDEKKSGIAASDAEVCSREKIVQFDRAGKVAINEFLCERPIEAAKHNVAESTTSVHSSSLSPVAASERVG